MKLEVTPRLHGAVVDASRRDSCSPRHKSRGSAMLSPRRPLPTNRSGRATQGVTARLKRVDLSVASEKLSFAPLPFLSGRFPLWTHKSNRAKMVPLPETLSARWWILLGCPRSSAIHWLQSDDKARLPELLLPADHRGPGFFVGRLPPSLAARSWLREPWCCFFPGRCRGTRLSRPAPQPPPILLTPWWPLGRFPGPDRMGRRAAPPNSGRRGSTICVMRICRSWKF